METKKTFADYCSEVTKFDIKKQKSQLKFRNSDVRQFYCLVPVGMTEINGAPMMIPLNSCDFPTQAIVEREKYFHRQNTLMMQPVLVPDRQVISEIANNRVAEYRNIFEREYSNGTRLNHMNFIDRRKEAYNSMSFIRPSFFVDPSGAREPENIADAEDFEGLDAIFQRVVANANEVMAKSLIETAVFSAYQSEPVVSHVVIAATIPETELGWFNDAHRDKLKQIENVANSIDTDGTVARFDNMLTLFNSYGDIGEKFSKGLVESMFINMLKRIDQQTVDVVSDVDVIRDQYHEDFSVKSPLVTKISQDGFMPAVFCNDLIPVEGARVPQDTINNATKDWVTMAGVRDEYSPINRPASKHPVFEFLRTMNMINKKGIKSMHKGASEYEPVTSENKNPFVFFDSSFENPTIDNEMITDDLAHDKRIELGKMWCHYSLLFFCHSVLFLHILGALVMRAYKRQRITLPLRIQHSLDHVDFLYKQGDMGHADALLIDTVTDYMFSYVNPFSNDRTNNYMECFFPLIVDLIIDNNTITIAVLCNYILRLEMVFFTYTTKFAVANLLLRNKQFTEDFDDYISDVTKGLFVKQFNAMLAEMAGSLGNAITISQCIEMCNGDLSFFSILQPPDKDKTNYVFSVHENANSMTSDVTLESDSGELVRLPSGITDIKYSHSLPENKLIAMIYDLYRGLNPRVSRFPDVATLHIPGVRQILVVYARLIAACFWFKCKKIIPKANIIDPDVVFSADVLASLMSYLTSLSISSNMWSDARDGKGILAHMATNECAELPSVKTPFHILKQASDGLQFSPVIPRQYAYLLYTQPSMSDDNLLSFDYIVNLRLDIRTDIKRTNITKKTKKGAAKKKSEDDDEDEEEDDESDAEDLDEKIEKDMRKRLKMTDGAQETIQQIADSKLAENMTANSWDIQVKQPLGVCSFTYARPLIDKISAKRQALVNAQYDKSNVKDSTNGAYYPPYSESETIALTYPSPLVKCMKKLSRSTDPKEFSETLAVYVTTAVCSMIRGWTMRLEDVISSNINVLILKHMACPIKMLCYPIVALVNTGPMFKDYITENKDDPRAEVFRQQAYASLYKNSHTDELYKLTAKRQTALPPAGNPKYMKELGESITGLEELPMNIALLNMMMAITDDTDKIRLYVPIFGKYVPAIIRFLRASGKINYNDALSEENAEIKADNISKETMSSFRFSTRSSSPLNFFQWRVLLRVLVPELCNLFDGNEENMSMDDMEFIKNTFDVNVRTTDITQGLLRSSLLHKLSLGKNDIAPAGYESNPAPTFFHLAMFGLQTLFFEISVDNCKQLLAIFDTEKATRSRYENDTYKQCAKCVRNIIATREKQGNISTIFTEKEPIALDTAWSLFLGASGWFDPEDMDGGKLDVIFKKFFGDAGDEKSEHIKRYIVYVSFYTIGNLVNVKWPEVKTRWIHGERTDFYEVGGRDIFGYAYTCRHVLDVTKVVMDDVLVSDTTPASFKNEMFKPLKITLTAGMMKELDIFGSPTRSVDVYISELLRFMLHNDNGDPTKFKETTELDMSIEDIKNPVTRGSEYDVAREGSSRGGRFQHIIEKVKTGAYGSGSEVIALGKRARKASSKYNADETMTLREEQQKKMLSNIFSKLRDSIQAYADNTDAWNLLLQNFHKLCSSTLENERIVKLVEQNLHQQEIDNKIADRLLWTPDGLKARPLFDPLVAVAYRAPDVNRVAVTGTSKSWLAVAINAMCNPLRDRTLHAFIQTLEESINSPALSPVAFRDIKLLREGKFAALKPSLMYAIEYHVARSTVYKSKGSKILGNTLLFMFLFSDLIALPIGYFHDQDAITYKRPESATVDMDSYEQFNNKKNLRHHVWEYAFNMGNAPSVVISGIKRSLGLAISAVLTSNTKNIEDSTPASEAFIRFTKIPVSEIPSHLRLTMLEDQTRKPSIVSKYFDISENVVNIVRWITPFVEILFDKRSAVLVDKIQMVGKSTILSLKDTIKELFSASISNDARKKIVSDTYNALSNTDVLVFSLSSDYYHEETIANKTRFSYRRLMSGLDALTTFSNNVSIDLNSASAITFQTDYVKYMLNIATKLSTAAISANSRVSIFFILVDEFILRNSKLTKLDQVISPCITVIEAVVTHVSTLPFALARRHEVNNKFVMLAPGVANVGQSETSYKSVIEYASMVAYFCLNDSWKIYCKDETYSNIKNSFLLNEGDLKVIKSLSLTPPDYLVVLENKPKIIRKRTPFTGAYYRNHGESWNAFLNNGTDEVLGAWVINSAATSLTPTHKPIHEFRKFAEGAVFSINSRYGHWFMTFYTSFTSSLMSFHQTTNVNGIGEDAYSLDYPFVNPANTGYISVAQLKEREKNARLILYNNARQLFEHACGLEYVTYDKKDLKEAKVDDDDDDEEEDGDDDDDDYDIENLNEDAKKQIDLTRHIRSVTTISTTKFKNMDLFVFAPLVPNIADFFWPPFMKNISDKTVFIDSLSAKTPHRTMSDKEPYQIIFNAKHQTPDKYCLKSYSGSGGEKRDEFIQTLKRFVTTVAQPRGFRAIRHDRNITEHPAEHDRTMEIGKDTDVDACFINITASFVDASRAITEQKQSEISVQGKRTKNVVNDAVSRVMAHIAKYTECFFAGPCIVVVHGLKNNNELRITRSDARVGSKDKSPVEFEGMIVIHGAMAVVLKRIMFPYALSPSSSSVITTKIYTESDTADVVNDEYNMYKNAVRKEMSTKSTVTLESVLVADKATNDSFIKMLGQIGTMLMNDIKNKAFTYPSIANIGRVSIKLDNIASNGLKEVKLDNFVEGNAIVDTIMPCFLNGEFGVLVVYDPSKSREGLGRVIEFIYYDKEAQSDELMTDTNRAAIFKKYPFISLLLSINRRTDKSGDMVVIRHGGYHHTPQSSDAKIREVIDSYCTKITDLIRTIKK